MASEEDINVFCKKIWVGFGSNLDNPIKQLQKARKTLAAYFVEKKVSSIYKTPAWGYTEQPDFFNAVIEYEVALSAGQILEILQHTENKQFRIRSFKNAPRTLDLDLLLAADKDQIELNAQNLKLPHPLMYARAFVLLPLLEIISDIFIPKQGMAKNLLNKLDQSGIVKISSAWDNDFDA